MKSHRIVAIAVASALAVGATQSALIAAGQQNASISGTAKKQAKKPYADFTVQARNVAQGTIGGTTMLDTDGNFKLPNLTAAKYLVELVNKDNKIVCTEGPFDLTQQYARNDVNIDCSKVPAAWWLLGAAAAAGVTAGIVAAGPASPAQ
jgi:hypothetical protein